MLRIALCPTSHSQPVYTTRRFRLHKTASESSLLSLGDSPWRHQSAVVHRALILLIAASAMTGATSKPSPAEPQVVCGAIDNTGSHSKCTPHVGNVDFVWNEGQASQRALEGNNDVGLDTDFDSINKETGEVTSIDKTDVSTRNRILSRPLRDLRNVVSILSIPLNRNTLLALATIIGLCCFGILHIMKLCMQVRRRCKCKLCRGDYAIVESLGHGGFGTVFLAKERPGLTSFTHHFTNWQSSTKSLLSHPQSLFNSNYSSRLQRSNRLVVLKKIPVSDITENDSIALEGRRLTGLRHPHMVRYLDDFLHQEFEFGRGVVAESPRCFAVVVMEYCEGGDIKQVIEEKWDELTESQVRTWIYQIARALQFLHDRGLIHRDVKSANVFLDFDGTARLGDFGLSRILLPKGLPSQLRKTKTLSRKSNDLNDESVRASMRGASRYDMELSQAGTDCYMAPEIHNNEDYGRPCDIWGLGCVLLELICGVFMWEFETARNEAFSIAVFRDRSIISKIVEERASSAISAKLKRLLIRMLHPDAGYRATLIDILRKKWLVNHRDLFPKQQKKTTTEVTFGETRRINKTLELAESVGSDDETRPTRKVPGSFPYVKVYRKKET